jgi:malate/lactate dehydrogenase
VDRIIEAELTPEETEALRNSAQVLKGVIAQVEI